MREQKRRPGRGPSDAASAARISPARRAALEVLLLVEQQRGHSDDLLHGRHLNGLSAADRNLATALVLGVLRWQIALDARVAALLQRPEGRLATPVAMALRLGAFQLLHMDRIPAHAALSESVELARAAGHAHAAGMVNAVLRKLAAAPLPGRKLHESTAAFAERLGHPLWLVERWVAAYGRDAALRICEADQTEPGCGELFVEKENAPVMDDGSRLVAELAAACAPLAKRVWDCCAAPGGKTLVLARRLPEALVLATDVSPSRTKLLAQRMEREGAANVRVEQMDAAAIAADEGEFDLILCDVPCSGTGTLARNPEVRHRLVPAEIVRQTTRQRVLLNAALRRLAPGGRLVYSTCSLEHEECEDVVAGVAGELPAGVRVASVDRVMSDLQRRAFRRPEMELSTFTQRGALRTLPGVGFAGDGFYAALFERAGE